MTIWNQITHFAFALREFVVPTYRPERYYMRGPGPACARRQMRTFGHASRFSLIRPRYCGGAFVPPFATGARPAQAESSTASPASAPNSRQV